VVEVVPLERKKVRNLEENYRITHATKIAAKHRNSNTVKHGIMNEKAVKRRDCLAKVARIQRTPQTLVQTKKEAVKKSQSKQEINTLKQRNKRNTRK
jgi:hypothetical protein